MKRKENANSSKFSFTSCRLSVDSLSDFCPSNNLQSPDKIVLLWGKKIFRHYYRISRSIDRSCCCAVTDNQFDCLCHSENYVWSAHLIPRNPDVSCFPQQPAIPSDGLWTAVTRQTDFVSNIRFFFLNVVHSHPERLQMKAASQHAERRKRLAVKWRTSLSNVQQPTFLKRVREVCNDELPTEEPVRKHVWAKTVQLNIKNIPESKFTHFSQQTCKLHETLKKTIIIISLSSKYLSLLKHDLHFFFYI